MTFTYRIDDNDLDKWQSFCSMNIYRASRRAHMALMANSINLPLFKFIIGTTKYAGLFTQQ